VGRLVLDDRAPMGVDVKRFELATSEREVLDVG
jgi:hypothetical protein